MAIETEDCRCVSRRLQIMVKQSQAYYVLHLLQYDVGVDHQVVTGRAGELDRILVTLGIERCAAPYVVSKVVLSDDLEDFAFLCLLDERTALQHA